MGQNTSDDNQAGQRRITENEARSLIGQLTHNEKLLLYELLTGLAQAA